MPNNFFKHDDKVYSENLNDGILVGNCFNVTFQSTKVVIFNHRLNRLTRFFIF